MTMAAVVAAECERRRVRAAYVPVVIGGKLAFRYDSARRVIEWQIRGEKHYIDLAALDDAARQTEGRGKAESGD